MHYSSLDVIAVWIQVARSALSRQEAFFQVRLSWKKAFFTAAFICFSSNNVGASLTPRFLTESAQVSWIPSKAERRVGYTPPFIQSEAQCPSRSASSGFSFNFFTVSQLLQQPGSYSRPLLSNQTIQIRIHRVGYHPHIEDIQAQSNKWFILMFFTYMLIEMWRPQRKKLILDFNFF